MATQLIRSQRETNQDTNWRNSLYYSLLNTEPFVEQKSQFLIQLLQHLDVRAGERILDLHSEKGDVARQLHNAGFQVDGLDNSKARIKYTRQFRQRGLCFQLHESAEQLTKNQYQFAYSLNSHFGQLETEEAQIDYLKNIATTLRPDGYLVIDYFNIQTLLPTLPQQRFQRMDEVLYQLRSQQDEQFILQKVKIQDGLYKGAYQAKTHIHFRESFEYLLLRAGLQIARVYGDYELQPFKGETSPRLILVIEKR